MINKDLGLFAYDSTNRETISAKRIENKHLLICKYLPSSLSSIISDIFTRISCLYRSFDSIRYIVEILIDQKAYYVLVFVSVVRTSWNKDGILFYSWVT